MWKTTSRACSRQVNLIFQSVLILLLHPSFSEDDNRSLCSFPTDLEIWEAVKGIRGMKAPGPDRFTALIFQKYWNVVRLDVIGMVRNFFRNGFLLKQINYTHIALIPKVDASKLISQFRPTSLCNVTYKIISKILTNRLKRVMPKLVSINQNAFVPNRHIQDNLITVQELMLTLKRKTGRGDLLAVKFDMEKAYDKMDWSFLIEVLKCFGSNDTWRHWIFHCISILSFSILFNGTPFEFKTFEFFKPSGGLRQGDPLSPFSFVLVTEVLSRLLKKEETRGSLHGIRIARSAPLVTNILFADDVMLFYRANGNEVHTLRRYLHTYDCWSGQVLNLHKSFLHFSRNLDQ